VQGETTRMAKMGDGCAKGRRRWGGRARGGGDVPLDIVTGGVGAGNGNTWVEQRGGTSKSGKLGGGRCGGQASCQNGVHGLGERMEEGDRFPCNKWKMCVNGSDKVGREVKSKRGGDREIDCVGASLGRSGQ